VNRTSETLHRDYSVSVPLEAVQPLTIDALDHLLAGPVQPDPKSPAECCFSYLQPRVVWNPARETDDDAVDAGTVFDGVERVCVRPDVLVPRVRWWRSVVSDNALVVRLEAPSIRGLM
jgi:hypothetical protein